MPTHPQSLARPEHQPTPAPARSDPPLRRGDAQAVRRIYVDLQPDRLVAIHVRNTDHSGDYFAVPLDGSPQAQLAQALDLVVSSAPNYCQLYLHTAHAALQALTRDQGRLEPGIRRTLRERNILLRSGSVTRLDGFWRDLLLNFTGFQHAQRSQHCLHTYGVTDGLQSYAGGILYGEGQIHAHTVRLKGSDLAPCELEISAWAVELLGPGKTIELHHHHPETMDFWDKSAEDFTDRYPGAGEAKLRIGRAVERKDLRFELVKHRRENAISRAVRDLVGRSLG